MKRILHIPNYYPPHIGGIEQTASDIVKSLEGDYLQAIICFGSNKETKIEEFNNVKLIRVGQFAKIASQAISMEYNKYLKKIITEFKPDYIHFHYPNPFVSHYLLKLIKNTNIKLVIHWHLDIIKQKFISKFFVNQNYKLLEFATKVIATSSNYVEGSAYLQKYKDKIEIIPSCINENRMELTDSILIDSNKIKEKYKDKTICLFLGRHVKHKGLKELIEAFELLDDKYVLFIGGLGPITDACVSLAENNKNIIFLGAIDDDEYKTYLNACDIFAFPSTTRAEAFGLALAEALYYGKPAITFNIPGSGVNYVNLDNVTGLEVPNKDIKAYSDAIVKLSDPELRLRLGSAGKERILNNFTFKQFETNIKQFYKNLESNK